MIGAQRRPHDRETGRVRGLLRSGEPYTSFINEARWFGRSSLGRFQDHPTRTPRRTSPVSGKFPCRRLDGSRLLRVVGGERQRGSRWTRAGGVRDDGNEDPSPQLERARTTRPHPESAYQDAKGDRPPLRRSRRDHERGV